MLSSKTLLIVGAGAGAEIDMPVGDHLSEIIAAWSDIRFGEMGTQKLSGDDLLWESMADYARENKINPNDLRAAGVAISQGIQHSKSIDNFVHAHKHKPHIATVAKLAIGRAILHAELGSALYRDPRADRPRFKEPTKVQKSWLQALMHILQEQVTFEDYVRQFFNNFSIINFNYDRCIEHFFQVALNELYRDPATTKLLIENLRIFHPYGTVGKLSLHDARTGTPFGSKPSSSALIRQAQHLKTYNEEVASDETMQAMLRLVQETETVIFLGFHFHKQNIQLLTPKLPPHQYFQPTRRTVYATCVNRSEPDLSLIRKRLGEIWDLGMTDLHLLKGVDCQGFYREYGSAITL